MGTTEVREAVLGDPDDVEFVTAAFGPGKAPWARCRFRFDEIAGWQDRKVSLADVVVFRWLGYLPDDPHPLPSTGCAFDWHVFGWGQDDLRRWHPRP